MISLDKYNKLKIKVEALQTEKARAEGALASFMTKLKDEYGCETLKEAKKLLEEYEDGKNKTEAAYEAAYEKFEEEWGETLGL